MSGDCWGYGNVTNNTSYPLWVVNSNINSGHWFNGVPTNVSAQATKKSWMATGTSGTATGTSGWIQYRLQGTSPSVYITVYFDDPYSSSNSASATCTSDAYTVSATCPKHGSSAIAFSYTVGPS